MPTYDYRCLKCGHEFEAFQSMKDPVLKTCPRCRKRGLKRLLGPGAGLIFKGSGFYITDYKRKKPAKAEGGKAPAAGDKPKTESNKQAKSAPASTPSSS